MTPLPHAQSKKRQFRLVHQDPWLPTKEIMNYDLAAQHEVNAVQIMPVPPFIKTD